MIEIQSAKHLSGDNRTEAMASAKPLCWRRMWKKLAVLTTISLAYGIGRTVLGFGWGAESSEPVDVIFFSIILFIVTLWVLPDFGVYKEWREREKAGYSAATE